MHNTRIHYTYNAYTINRLCGSVRTVYIYGIAQLHGSMHLKGPCLFAIVMGITKSERNEKKNNQNNMRNI